MIDDSNVYFGFVTGVFQIGNTGSSICFWPVSGTGTCTCSVRKQKRLVIYLFLSINVGICFPPANNRQYKKSRQKNELTDDIV